MIAMASTDTCGRLLQYDRDVLCLLLGTRNPAAYRDEPVTKRFKHRMATPHSNMKPFVVFGSKPSLC
jgi:hypothetical protein